MKEIEADGYITRDQDLSPIRDTCFNCNNYRYDFGKRRYRCYAGREVGKEDWRMKYSVCDLWERKKGVNNDMH